MIDHEAQEKGPEQQDEDSVVVLQEHDTISFRQHLKDVWAITYPIILSEIFQNTLPVVDIGFVGHLGKDELAAAALATVWFNLWNGTMIGYMTAIDTLLAQAFGAQQLEKFSIWAGNSMVIIFFTTIVFAGLVALCGPAMRLFFGKDSKTADAAGEFSYRLIPGLFPYFMFKVLSKYLQTQNILAPVVWIGILANGMNVLFNWVLIFVLDWGIHGAPWATTLTRTAEFAFILGYLYWKKKDLQSIWPKVEREYLTLKVLRPFWKLAISGALSVSAEAWSFEISTILAGFVGVTALDAHIITLTFATFVYLSFPFAIGIAASIRVGQLIGEKKPIDAKKSFHGSLVFSATAQAILTLILLLGLDVWGNLFTGDEEVADLVAKLIPISCIFMMGDAITATNAGVLRGLGRQKLVLVLGILGFWVFQVPVGAILTFVADLGVSGLWWGMICGVYVAAVIGLWILKVRIDWVDETIKAVKRLSTISSAQETSQA